MRWAENPDVYTLYDYKEVNNKGRILTMRSCNVVRRFQI